MMDGRPMGLATPLVVVHDGHEDAAFKSHFIRGWRRDDTKLGKRDRASAGVSNTEYKPVEVNLLPALNPDGILTKAVKKLTMFEVGVLGQHVQYY
jgi:hypothetical protein